MLNDSLSIQPSPFSPSFELEGAREEVSKKKPPEESSSQAEQPTVVGQAELYFTNSEENKALDAKFEQSLSQMRVFAEFGKDPIFDTIMEEVRRTIDELVDTSPPDETDQNSITFDENQNNSDATVSDQLEQNSVEPTSENEQARESLKQIFSPELFPTVEESLKYAGNVSLIMTFVNAGRGAQELKELQQELNQARTELESVKEKLKSESANRDLTEQQENLSNKIYLLEADYAAKREEAALTLLENAVLASGRDLSRVSLLLSIAGAGSKVALAAGAAELAGSGLHVALSIVDLYQQSKQRDAIQTEAESLQTILKEQKPSPPVKKIVEYRLKSLSKQYDRSAIDTVQSSVWLASSSLSASAAVGAALIALGVSLPPVGLGLIAVAGLIGTLTFGGLLITGAGRFAYRNREVIQITGKKVNQWYKDRKLTSQQTGYFKKFEELDSNLGRLSARIQDFSRRAYQDIKTFNEQIRIEERKIQELKSKGIQTQYPLAHLATLSRNNSENMRANQRKITSLFQKIPQSQNQNQLRQKLQDLSLTQNALKQERLELESQYALHKATARAQELKEKALSCQNKINQMIEQHTYILSEANQYSLLIQKSKSEQTIVRQTRQDLREKVQDSKRSQQLGVPLKVYVEYKNEIMGLLTDEEAQTAVYDFLKTQVVDVSEFKQKPIDAVMTYITRTSQKYEK